MTARVGLQTVVSTMNFSNDNQFFMHNIKVTISHTPD